MQRYIAIFVSIALMTVAFAGSASAEPSDDAQDRIEPYLEMRDWYEGQADWDEVESTTHGFVVPAGSTYSFTVDWTTGQTQVDVLEVPMIAGTGVGPNAGCVSQPGSEVPWAQPGIGVDDCGDSAEIQSSLASTTVVCATDAESCYTDAADAAGFIHFGVVSVTCGGQAVDQVDWAGPGAAVGQSCTIDTLGTLAPADFQDYTSVCGSATGASGVLAGCVHSP